MKEKALVIESGDILDILSEYITMPMTFSINLEDPSTNKSKSGKKTKNYSLSNGNSYKESEIIVGLDNIREYKLKNII